MDIVILCVAVVIGLAAQYGLFYLGATLGGVQEPSTRRNVAIATMVVQFVAGLVFSLLGAVLKSIVAF